MIATLRMTKMKTIGVDDDNVDDDNDGENGYADEVRTHINVLNKLNGS